MRLWTLHPKYLDEKGLVALWREALLAKAVLGGKTQGYRHHPQLARFRACANPRAAIDAYLRAVLDESLARGYAFDARKAGRARPAAPIPATDGQLAHEWSHLARKLRARDPAHWRRARRVTAPEPHPLFRLIPGPAAEWERISPVTRRAGGAPRAGVARPSGPPPSAQAGNFWRRASSGSR